MKKIALLLSIFCLAWLGLYNQSYAAINFTVTPIKYELELSPWESITLPASIRNNGTWSVTLPTTTSDFTSNGTSWVPAFVRKSELVYPDQQLSSWITIADSSLTIAPSTEATTYFTIDVPTDATPGWHYGAVLFRNDNSESSTGGWNIGINVDYWILILVNVSGEVVVDIDIEDPEVKVSWRGVNWWGSVYWPNISNEAWEGAWYLWEDENGEVVYQNQDICAFGDFTPSKYDGKCIDDLFSDDDEPVLFSWDDQSTNTDGEEPLLFSWDFEVQFNFPIKNKWNTHVKPKGNITLRDENGNTITNVWREVITNDRWAVIGHKIVDYIPINDSDGVVLPNSTRIFNDAVWKGFPYKVFDDAWNPDIKYWSPSEYYTRQNKEDAGFLMFWERVSEVRQNKMITADISMTYFDSEGNPIQFNSAKEFPVQYIEQRVTNNPYVILGMLLLATAAIMLWFGLRWLFAIAYKDKKCWNCWETIKSHWETCPYCKKLQDKKKQEKLDKNSPSRKVKKK